MSLFGVDSFTYNNLAAKLSGNEIVVKNSPSADGFDMDRAVEMANIASANNPEQEEIVDEEEDFSETNEKIEVPEKKTVQFKMSKKWFNNINNE